MAIITPSQLTFNGQEVQAFGELIMQRLYTYPQINQYSTVWPNVKVKTQLGFMGNLSKITRLDPGCGSGQYTPTIPMSQKYLDPKDLKIWLQICWKELLPSFMAYYEREFVNKPDLTATQIFDNWLIDNAANAMLEDAIRIAWFGNTAVAAGDLTNGAPDVPNYNQINGYWKQIFAIITADATKKVTIAKNAAATYVLQAFDDTDTTNKVATKIFQKLILGGDSRLRSAPDAVILATQSLVDQYLQERLSFTNIEASYQLALDGDGKQINGLYFIPVLGVDVYVINQWDRIIGDFVNPTYPGAAALLPHRAVYTTKSNLVQSLDGGDLMDSNVWKVWYSDDTELSNIKALYKTDVIVVEDYLVRAAY